MGATVRAPLVQFAFGSKLPAASLSQQQLAPAAHCALACGCEEVQVQPRQAAAAQQRAAQSAAPPGHGPCVRSRAPAMLYEGRMSAQPAVAAAAAVAPSSTVKFMFREAWSCFRGSIDLKSKQLYENTLKAPDRI